MSAWIKSKKRSGYLIHRHCHRTITCGVSNPLNWLVLAYFPNQRLVPTRSAWKSLDCHFRNNDVITVNTRIYEH